MNGSRCASPMVHGKMPLRISSLGSKYDSAMFLPFFCSHVSPTLWSNTACIIVLTYMSASAEEAGDIYERVGRRGSDISERVGRNSAPSTAKRQSAIAQYLPAAPISSILLRTSAVIETPPPLVLPPLGRLQVQRTDLGQRGDHAPRFPQQVA
eukprot:12505196-Heterocapsa_arctica.AAC.1